MKSKDTQTKPKKRGRPRKEIDAIWTHVDVKPSTFDDIQKMYMGLIAPSSFPSFTFTSSSSQPSTSQPMVPLQFSVGDKVEGINELTHFTGTITDIKTHNGDRIAVVYRDDMGPGWDCRILPDGRIATGNGMWDGKHFLQPLSSASKTPTKTTPQGMFKVGDRVRIANRDCKFSYTPEMEQYLGKETTIINVNGDIIDLEIDGGLFNWSANQLELVKPKPIKPKVKLSSVVLSTEKINEIRAAISQVENDTTIFSKWGFSDIFEKGTAVSLLFWGIPGTGKTLTAQAIADEIGAELKLYGTADIESSEPGGAERMMRTIFAEAKKKREEGKQRVILFDECDSLLMDRNEIGPILAAQVNALLTEIERYEGIIIFTTNRLGKLDPALERRITAKIEFEFPDHEARKKIWKRMIPKKAPLAKDVDFDTLAQHALAGGNIKNVVLNAARMATYEKARQITKAHFLAAIEREVKSLEAFVSAYEKQTHNRQLGQVNRSNNGLEIDRKAINKQLFASIGRNN